MAYSPREDGLYDVTLGNGMTVPMSLTEDQLRAAGHEPLAPNPGTPLPPEAVAGPGGAEPFTNPYGPPAPAPIGPPPPPSAFYDPSKPAPPPAPAPPPDLTLAPGPPPGGFGGIPADRAKVGFGEGIVDAFSKMRTRNLSGETVEKKPLFNLPGSSPKNAEEAKPDTKPDAGKADPKDLVPLTSDEGAQNPYSRGSGGGGIVKIKGGSVLANFTRVPGQEVPDDVKNDIKGDTRAEDLELSAATIADQRDAITNDREKLLLDQQKEFDLERARRAKVDQELQRKSQLIDQRDREAEALKPQSAKEVWQSKSTAAQAMGIISVALGGYLQGLTGMKNNPGLDQVNGFIDQEVADQRAKYEYALANKKDAQNEYAKAIQLYGTPEAAELDLRMRMYGNLENMLKVRGEKIGTQEYLQASNAAAQELRQQRAETKLRLYELEHGKTVKQEFVNVPDRFVSTGGPPKLKPEHRERAVRLPNGNYVFARSAEAAKKAQAQIKVDTGIRNAASRLRYLRNQPGAKTDPAIRGQIAGAGANLFINLKEGANIGTLDKGALDFRTEWTGDVNALLDMGGVDAKLEEVGRAADIRINDTMQYDLQADPESLTPITGARPRAQSDE